MNYKINTVMDNKKLGQVKNLIMLALADGKASESELAIIASVASREKLSESEVTHLIDNPDSVKIELPDDESVKLRYIEDMVSLMMIDGEINDNELALCKLYAITLGYESTIVEKMILDIVEKLK
ncbi:MAG: TerB family tellurite resistance protein [Muribaculaceae bacterium]|nr:TerB family tellurite resistance protein [Muribaculaceae bacterium]MBR1726217.1 TerB family tellurite resistance protein [Muribaculaceae bacterium]